jgi:hypothetical protein
LAKKKRALFPAKPGTKSLPDPSLPDPSLPDPGLPDLNLPDLNLPDPGRPDPGLPDAGPPDLGLSDPYPSDAGVPDDEGAAASAAEFELPLDDGDDDFEAMDRPDPRRRAARPKRKPDHQREPKSDGGGLFELDDDVPVPSNSGRGGGRADGLGDEDDDDDADFGLDDDDGFFGPDSSADSSEGKMAPLPTAAVVAPNIEPAEVEALAQYGEAPRNPVLAVPYAWRVLRRRTELRDLLADQKKSHDETKRKLQAKLAAHVETFRALDDDRVRGILRPLAAADQATKERLKKLAASDDQFRAQAKAIEREQSSRQDDRRTMQDKLTAAKAAHDKARRDEARLKAQLKRLDLELRRLHERAREMVGGDAKFAPPEIARKLAPLEQKRKRALGQLKQQRQRVKAARNAVAGRKHALAELANELGGVRSKSRQMADQAEIARRMGSRAVREAEDARLDAYEEALRRVIAQLPKLVDNTMRVAVAGIDNEQRENASKLELHRRAVDSYDHTAFRQGQLVVGALVAALVVLVVSSTRLG